jgi:hypothetical protein
VPLLTPYSRALSPMLFFLGGFSFFFDFSMENVDSKIMEISGSAVNHQRKEKQVRPVDVSISLFREIQYE